MPTPKKKGRTLLLNEETQNTIVTSIRAGNYADVAAAAAGISKKTYYSWIKKGQVREQEIADAKRDGTELCKDPNGDLCLDFLHAVEKAEGESEVRDMTIIGLAAQKDWRAAAWRLEHRNPKRYGGFNRVEVTGSDGSPLVPAPAIDISKMSPAEQDAFIKSLYANAPQGGEEK